MARLLALVLLIATIATLEGSKMEMPSFATVGEKVVIECRMHQDDHVIEHIQWYKDNQLFYVFVPNKNPPVATFDVPGVQINADDSKNDKLVLNSVSGESSGVYTCELKLDHGMARMSGTLTVVPVKEK